jgi:hypothetical protein
MEVSDQLHAPAALPQGKKPWYQLDRWLGGPQSRSGRGGMAPHSDHVYINSFQAQTSGGNRSLLQVIHAEQKSEEVIEYYTYD